MRVRVLPSPPLNSTRSGTIFVLGCPHCATLPINSFNFPLFILQSKGKFMTQNDKELLLKDLCSRLPYGIFVYDEIDNKSIYTISYHPHIDNCKPYLRPMSSMTEEEENELATICVRGGYKYSVFKSYLVDDWLNAHHFDYRGLIPMGLALEAPDGMYKTE